MKTKPPKKKRASRSSSRKAMVPVAASAPAADEMYIRVPVPPEVVRGVRKHVDAFAELLESARTLDGSAKAIGSLVDRVLQAGAELEADVRRAQRAMRR